MSVKVF